MNRIKISPLATVSSSQTKDSPNRNDSLSSHFNFDKITKLPDVDFFSFVPIHYEKNYAYPLIVWLHPDGEKPDAIQHVIPQASIRNFVGIAPQAPVGNVQTGYYWEQELETIDLAHDSVTAAIDHATARFNIDPNRIFLSLIHI